MAKPSVRIVIITTCILGVLGAVALLAPQTRRQTRAVPQADDEGIRLIGIVRDFHQAHPDFQVVPAGGPGHSAGNAALALSPLKRPVFSPDGYEVQTEWRDDADRPIAPHLAMSGPPAGGTAGAGVRVHGSIELSGTTVIDSFDSTLGPYGVDGNVGAEAIVSTNSIESGAVSISSGCTIGGDVFVGVGGDPGAVIDGGGGITGTVGTLAEPYPMPVIAVPGDEIVGPNVGDVWYHHDPATISSNMHVDDFRISTDSVVTISGNVTILVEGEFRTETKGVLQVLAGSSLDIYLTGPKFTVETKCLWSDPRNTRVHVVGTPLMKIQTDAAFYGTIHAPDAHLLVQTDADLYGSFVGQELECKTGGSIHVDLAGSVTNGCLAIDDQPGSSGADDDGGITSAETFGQWFRDVLGVNQSMPYEIVLTADGAGMWEYASDAFYPIDSRLFGNEGQPHNLDFTYALQAAFTFEECAGQFIEIEGGDGAWLFVNDQLAVDLGGVGTTTEQRIDLDRLGLADGSDAMARLFLAQRRTSGSTFRLRTNVQLSTEGFVPTFTRQYD